MKIPRISNFIKNKKQAKPNMQISQMYYKKIIDNEIQICFANKST